MAERVVVGLEAIEVVQPERERSLLGLVQRLLDIGVQLAAVRKAGQGVVQGVMLVQPGLLEVRLLGELALGDVLEHRGRVGAPAVLVHLGDRRDAEPDHLAVLAEAALLEPVGLARAFHDLVEQPDVLLDVVGMRVLLEPHRSELGFGVSEHLLHRGVRLDHAPRPIGAHDADRRAVEDGAIARERVVALDLRLPQVGDLDHGRRDAHDLAVGRDDRATERAEIARVLGIVRVASHDLGSDRRLPGLEDPDRRRDDLRRETRKDLVDRTSEDLGLGLIAEHAEHAICPHDAKIAVDDRDPHRGLADEGVEQRLGLQRCADRPRLAVSRRLGRRIRRRGHNQPYRPLVPKD